MNALWRKEARSNIRSSKSRSRVRSPPLVHHPFIESLPTIRLRRRKKTAIDKFRSSKTFPTNCPLPRSSNPFIGPFIGPFRRSSHRTSVNNPFIEHVHRIRFLVSHSSKFTESIRLSLSLSESTAKVKPKETPPSFKPSKIGHAVNRKTRSRSSQSRNTAPFQTESVSSST